MRCGALDVAGRGDVRARRCKSDDVETACQEWYTCGLRMGCMDGLRARHSIVRTPVERKGHEDDERGQQNVSTPFHPA